LGASSNIFGVEPSGSSAVNVNGIYNNPAPTLTPGSTAQLQLDSKGSLYVDAEGRKATYRAVFQNIAPLVGAQFNNPFVVLQGSATKTVKITRCRLSIHCTTGATTPANPYFAIINGVTGGTLAGLNNVGPLDSNDPAPSAQASSVTVGFTTSVGLALLDSFYYQLTTVSATTAPQPPPVDAVFGGAVGNKLPTLHGTAQYFSMGMSAAGTGNVVSGFIEWTEE
jgi:hypothetical protein